MTQPLVEPDVERFYANVYTEDGRLERSAHGRAEFVRTQELLRRLLPAPPAAVLDVGGGPGAHARQVTDQLFRDAMTCARAFETDPAVIGTSSHLLAAARVGPPR